MIKPFRLPEAKVSLDGEYATDVIQFLWPWSFSISLPVLTSQSLIVLSHEPN